MQKEMMLTKWLSGNVIWPPGWKATIPLYILDLGKPIFTHALCTLQKASVESPQTTYLCCDDMESMFCSALLNQGWKIRSVAATEYLWCINLVEAKWRVMIWHMKEAFAAPFKHTGFMTLLLTSSYSLNALLFIRSSENDSWSCSTRSTDNLIWI